MSDKRIYFLQPEPHPSRRLAKAQIDLTQDGYSVEIKEPSRTLDQNAYQVPYLEGFAQQLKWPVNGEMVSLDKLEWKDILTAAFEEEVKPRLAMGWDGGIVMLGRRTSQYGKRKFADWMTFLMAAAALKGVEPVFKDGEYKRWQPEAEKVAA